MTTRPFGIRLFTQGKERVERDMRETGRAGDKAFARIDASRRKTSRGMRLFNQASREAQDGLRGLANQAPGVGRLAASLGRIGYVVTALAGGFLLASRNARTAASEIAAIGDAADRIGGQAGAFDPGEFERIRAALTLEGQENTGLERSLRGFVRRLGEARGGSVEASKIFKDLNVDLDEIERNGEGLEDVLARVSDGFAAIEDPARRSALAQKLFEEGGAALLTVLSRGSESYRALGDEAERLGLVLGTDVIRKAQEANVVFDTQSQIIGTSAKNAWTEFLGPAQSVGQVFVTASQFAFDFVGAVGKATTALFEFLNVLPEGFERPLGQQLEANQTSIREIEAQLADLSRSSPRGRNARGLEGRIRELQQRRADLIVAGRILESRIENANTPVDSPGSDPARPQGGASGGVAQSQRDPFEQATDAIQKQIDAENFRIRTFGLSKEAVAALRAEEALRNAALADGQGVSAAEQQAIERLTESIRNATAETERLKNEQRAAAEASREAERTFQTLSNTALNTFQGLTSGTLSWADALFQVGRAILQIDGVQSSLSDFFTGGFNGAVSLFAADGAVVGPQGVVPFRDGGLISRPTLFGFGRGQLGIAGEAGEEVIAPVIRNSRGQVGVASVAPPAPNVNVAIYTRDPDTRVRIEPSRGQQSVAASRAIERGGRFG